MENLRQAYNKCNSSFNKKVVFRIGISAGFFSEYNNMIFTMHYCMINKIRFILNSNDANFSYKNGWQDYFMPFTTEYTFFLNKYYNIRHAPPLLSRLRDKIGYALFKLWLKVRQIDFTTWQLFQEARNQNTLISYSIDGFNLSGTLADNCGAISKYVWRFKPSVKQLIDAICDSISLPSEYIGIHIRRGDKINETYPVPLEDYMLKAITISSCRNAFIATDDYTVIEDLKIKYSDWKIYTLCKPMNRGYDQNKQAQKDKSKVKEDMIILFAEIELLSNATCFIGTFSSNVALHMIMRLTESKCYGVDFEKWRIW